MDKVLSQKAPWSYEIIAIDSGSKDGTQAYLGGLDGVRLTEIAPGDFGHGRTRNLGVELADADFVAFLTHDAQPLDENWLVNLVATAEQDEHIAGVFGRHIAYPSASPFTKNDIDKHFANFLNHPLVVSRALAPERYDTDEGWRQFLHFYSDNNSLLRKAIWKKFPYPDVEFAEDQIWARTIIEAGYRKAYAPDAAVYHSHDYGAVEQLRRAFDESRNFTRYFGYKLSPDPGKAVVAAGRMAVKALRQEVGQEYGSVTRGQRLQRAAQCAALVVGHCLGANHERIPKRIVKHLSLDEKLFRS
jgi:rhamnosyltransferase